MTLHRPAIVLWWWGCLRPPPPTSSVLSPSFSTKIPPEPPIQSSKHAFATSSSPKTDPPPPPPRDHWPACPNPTPYEIFRLRKDEAYTKTPFNHLVKLYHPDRHNHVSLHGLTPAARLERYRLVVLAHAILSDPHKRRAYDLCGAGWGRPATRTGRGPDGRSWRHQPGSAAGNATWEDWERWYEMRDGRGVEQTPLFMSNTAFAMLVLAFVAVGGLAQATRAEARGADLAVLSRERHAAISEDMTRRIAASSGRSPVDRVETFLRDRENATYYFEAGRYDGGDEPGRPK